MVEFDFKPSVRAFAPSAQMLLLSKQWKSKNEGNINDKMSRNTPISILVSVELTRKPSAIDAAAWALILFPAQIERMHSSSNL